MQNNKKNTQDYSLLENTYIAKGYTKIHLSELQYPMDIIVPELIDEDATADDFDIFSLQNAEDLQFLNSFGVQHVWALKNTMLPSKAMKKPNTPKQNPTQRLKEIRAQTKPAKKIYEPLSSEVAKNKNFFKESYQQTRATFSILRQTGILNIQGVTQVVDDITTSVARNPSTLLCLRGLQKADEYIYFHSINVGLFASIFAQYLGYTEDEIWCITLAGILHDIGKETIPLGILHATRKLTIDEFILMKKHPQSARDILKSEENLDVGIVEGICCHHEKFDGSGYPYGLAGDEIHPYATILSLADIYDALTSERPHKRPVPQNKTASMIYNMRGTSFSADMAEQFVSCFGVYPIGCLVRLNTGEYGIVYENNDDDLLNPKILRLTSSFDKILMRGAKSLDLRKFTKSMQIVACEDMKKFDFDLEEVLLSAL